MCIRDRWWSTSVHPFPCHASKTTPKGAQIGIFHPNHQRHKITVYQTASLRRWQGIYSLSMGIRGLSKTPNWRISKPRWRTAAVLEIHKQVYLGHFLTGLHIIWSASRTRSLVVNDHAEPGDCKQQLKRGMSVYLVLCVACFTVICYPHMPYIVCLLYTSPSPRDS